MVIAMTFVSTKPLPTVSADGGAEEGPGEVARRRHEDGCARREDSLVETTVAMAFAASWKPLMYSKINATTRTMRKIVIDQAYLSAVWNTIFPASRQRSMPVSSSS